MTDRPGDVQRGGGRGKLIVALIVLAVVAGVVIWALGADDRRSTPVEDAVAGREMNPDSSDLRGDPNAAAPVDARPQGRDAPDSDEGQTGAGTPSITGEAPPTSDTGRNAPAGDNRAAQNAPDGSLTSGPDRAPATTAPRQ
jgi:hypothetical protein